MATVGSELELVMTPFIRLPYRSAQKEASKPGLPPWVVVLLLVLILCLQIGLLLLIA